MKPTNKVLGKVTFRKEKQPTEKLSPEKGADVKIGGTKKNIHSKIITPAKGWVMVPRFKKNTPIETTTRNSKNNLNLRSCMNTQEQNRDAKQICSRANCLAMVRIPFTKKNRRKKILTKKGADVKVLYRKKKQYELNNNISKRVGGGYANVSKTRSCKTTTRNFTKNQPLALSIVAQNILACQALI